MSWRQPEKARAADTKDTKEAKDTKDRTEDREARERRVPFVTSVTFVPSFLIGNCGDLPRTEGRQELARPFESNFGSAA
jgi:hypothetical protein